MIKPDQIRAARALKDLSQQDLADMTGLSRPSINLIEKGKSDPRASNLEAIQQALEAAGVVFLSETDSDGVGVRLKKLPAQIDLEDAIKGKRHE